MKILVDITHIEYINFFRNSLQALKARNHDIIILLLQRGNLLAIARKELKGMQLVRLGKYSGGIFSVIFQANILRFFQLLFFLFKYKVDIGVSCGSLPLAICLKLKRVPNLQFDDDIHRRIIYFLQKFSYSKLFVPPICRQAKKIHIINALREWSYLSPKYFKPNPLMPKQYGINLKEYIFIREIDTKSLNYICQKKNIVTIFANKLPPSIKILFSLENKKDKQYYPQDWIILEEPVENIHSLMYYSKIIISSGDSMPREGALLGVPSIYCGSRKMPANKFIEKKGMFYQIEPQEVAIFVEKILHGDILFENQDTFRQRLFQEWDDVTELIVKEVEKYIAKVQ
ncbi:MAG: DUF354 domain-containing protein [Candidatus Omnitrophota bacterium]|jgi:hypothetical protein